MTSRQVLWASKHDWFRSYEVLNDGSVIVWCRSDRPEGGIVPFSDINKLKSWAGY